MLYSYRFLFLILIFFGFQLTAFAQNQAQASKETPLQKEASRIKKLSKGADVIVTGKVTQKKSNWNENKTKIYTRTTVQVDEYLKGENKGNFVEISYPGGEVGDIGEVYTHMPKFDENEEVLVFLKKDEKDKGYNVLNGEAGKIKIHLDQKTEKKVTSSDLPVNDLKSQIKRFVNEP